MHQAILDQLQGFGLEEEEAEFTVSVAKQILLRETEWGDDAGAKAWRRVAAPIDPSSGAPLDLGAFRSAARTAAAAGEAGPAERKAGVFTLFVAAACAVATRAQDLRILSFGDGGKFDFVYRSSRNGRRAYGFFRPRRGDGEAAEALAAGAAPARVTGVKRTADTISRHDVNKVPELLSA